MAAKEKVMYDDPDIVEYKTDIKGWVGKNNMFYGKDEHLARFANSTHKLCDCGKIMCNGWTKCEWCRAKSDTERYYKLPYKEWDGKAPLVLHDSDEYFFDEDAIHVYCEENDIRPTDLRLVTCEPNYLSEIQEDRWEDILPEDRYLKDIYPELCKKIDELNKYIKTLPITSWGSGKYRTSL